MFRAPTGRTARDRRRCYRPGAGGQSLTHDDSVAEVLLDLQARAGYYANLDGVGVPVPAAEAEDAATVRAVADAVNLTQPSGGDGPAEELRRVRGELGDCRRCKLAGGRRNIVFGQGNPNAKLMFVGEAPGADEDEQGLAFVGRAGQLLTRIIEAIGLRRDDVWIANVLMCRPPENRNPEPDEIEACQPFLEAKIASIRPRVIVGLGKFGAQWLLQTAAPITRLRGRLADYPRLEGIKVMPTYHPAYLLRNPAAKKDVWEDMKVVRGLISD